jgi:phosphoserine phosphatase
MSTPASTRCKNAEAGGKLAVFDVCGTLYRSNTTYDFIDYYLKSGPLYRWALFRILRSSLLIPLRATLEYSLGKDIFRILAVRMLRGCTEQDVCRGASRLVREILSRRQKASVLSLMTTLQSEGYTVALASASLSFVVKEIAAVLNVSHYVACSLESQNGILTGRFLADIRGQKERMISIIFPQWSDLVVVTDNQEDANLILLASRAWIICDRRKRWRWSRAFSGHIAFLE